MAAGSVPCPECGQPVPADRAACANCGALLRPGAGAMGEAPGPAAEQLAAFDEEHDAAGPLGSTPAGDPVDAADVAVTAGASEAPPAAPAPVADSDVVTAAVDAAPAPGADADLVAAAVDAAPAPAVDAGVLAAESPDVGLSAAVPHAGVVAARPAVAASPPDAASTGDDLEVGTIGPAVSAPAAPNPSVAVPDGLVRGAYLPPSAVHRPERVAPPPPQMPLAASPTVGAPPPATAADWVPIAAPPPAPPPAQPGRASLFADLPFDAPDTMAEWLVAVGSGISAISFLLPWISGTVSYDTSWGLATASRLPILGLLVVTAVLGILPNRVAGWVRSGVLGLLGGSLFLGVLWPIVAGDYGDAAFGAVIGAAATIVLIVGGIVGVAPRSSPVPPG